MEDVENYRIVVNNLEDSTAMSEETTAIIADVKQNITGDEYERRKTEYTTEKNVSEALLSEVMALDYQPQGKNMII